MKIEVIVTADGKTTVHTKGFVGKLCHEASRFIEQALGQQLTEQRTAEFYQSHRVQEYQRHKA